MGSDHEGKAPSRRGGRSTQSRRSSMPESEWNAMMKRRAGGATDWALESSNASARKARREAEAMDGQKTPSAIIRQEKRDAEAKAKGKAPANGDMGALIQQIKECRDSLFADTYRDEVDDELLTAHIERLEAQHEEVKKRLELKKKLTAEYEKTQKLTNQAYTRLMETAQSLNDALEQ